MSNSINSIDFFGELPIKLIIDIMKVPIDNENCVMNFGLFRICSQITRRVLCALGHVTPIRNLNMDQWVKTQDCPSYSDFQSNAL